MKKLTYVKGDVASPVSNGPHIIAHLCNDVGIWTGCVARQISRRWPEAERAFLRWYRKRTKSDFGLGSVQFVKAFRVHVNRVTRIANMVAIRGCQQAEPFLTRNQRLAWCLGTVGKKAWKLKATVHLPKFQMENPALWGDVELLIRCAIVDIGVPVFVYEPEADRSGQMLARVIKSNRPTKRWNLL